MEDKKLEKPLNNMQDYTESAVQRLADCLRAKEQFENILKTLKPSDIITNYKNQVKELAKDCIALNVMKINKISSLIECQHEYSGILKVHQENLVQKQQQFENFIAHIKRKFYEYENYFLNIDKIHCHHLKAILEKVEDVKISVESECYLFKRPFPAYGLRADVLKCVMENQVTIISADSSYLLNIEIPLFIKQTFPNYHLISCESCELMTSWLKRNIENLFQSLKYDVLICRDESSFLHFKTENEMLFELANGNKIYEDNFIIILNLPLKRTIVVDLLLNKLCSVLQNNKNSKLILLLSPYDDISKYKNYFAVFTKASAIVAPNMNFPVQTLWKSSSLSVTDDCKHEAIQTVFAIHAINQPGDILVFLPSTSDARFVSAILNKNFKACNLNDAECIILHEKLAAPCLDVSNQTKLSKRIIFISTGCEENLVIPSVRYIVDCGLRNEYIFDNIKNLDIVKSAFISHAKANLRKSLVGMTSNGICYRLYNKGNFCKEMPHKEYPEILTVNTVDTLIKIFNLSDTASSVHFIDSIPEVAKSRALDYLKKYNVVKNEKLTVLGKKIVKLPFPFKYSKLILQGIQLGLAYEVVVIVVFFTIEAKVFLCSDNANKQQIIDGIKLQLVQSDSDVLFHLYIFKLWLENSSSSSWCDKYYINFCTMKLVYSKVKDICSIINNYLKENIVQTFSDNNNMERLTEILFDCFLENLCVFSGHHRTGYRSLFSRFVGFIHPSSVVYQKENLPQFIIFDHILSTQEDVLIHITTIPNDLVIKAVTEGKLKCDFSDFEKTLKQTVVECEQNIEDVFIGENEKKLKTIENYVKKELNCQSVIIEPLSEKRSLVVYTLESHIDSVTNLIKRIVKNNFVVTLNVEQSIIYELVKGKIKIPIEVKLVKGAKIVSAKVKPDAHKMAIISNSLIRKSESSFAIQQSINLTWVRRRDVGYVTFFNASDFMKARKLAFQCFQMLEAEIFVKISETDQNQLLVYGIPPGTNQRDFENAFKNLLPDIKFQKIELVLEEPFDTSSNELKDIKTQIQEDCEEYINLNAFDIVVPKPKATDTIFKAFIFVHEDIDLEYAADMLSNIMMGNFKVTAVPEYCSVIKYNANICRLLQCRFTQTIGELGEDLIAEYGDEDIFSLNVTELNDDVSALIKMRSKYKDVIKILRGTVSDLLEGEVLKASNLDGILKLFSHGGHILLKTLERNENVYILEDKKSETIRLYGSHVNCFCAKENIMKFLKETENEVEKSIDLTSKDGCKALMKKIILKYGANLENFIECCELRSATLNIGSSHLLIYGCQESCEKAENCIKELSSCITSVDMFHEPNSRICSVCACPVHDPAVCLQGCGHLYCHECVQGLFDQAHFPIQCCAENCSKDIVLDDIWIILENDAKKINMLLEKSMQDYLEKNNSDVIYCPVPGCNMFFHRSEAETRWICPLCENYICVSCSALYHQGYTCDMYKESKSDFESKICDSTLAECKICPKCKSPFEKDEDCIHVMCNACQAYFCWLCLREFPSAAEVDSHQPYCSEYSL